MRKSNRREAIQLLTGGTGASLLPVSFATGANAKQAGGGPNGRPNILFMLVDNLGYGEVGCYGGGATRGAPTPRIDKLAAEGLRLTNMNMETQCTPSRSAILTGRYAIRSGTHSVTLDAEADGLTQWEVTLAEALSDRGYDTALFGKWHLGANPGRHPNDQGFDEWYGIPKTTHESMWPGSLGWSEEIMPAQPIFEGRKGERSRPVRIYDEAQRRIIDADITHRTIDFMRRSNSAGRPFFAYACLTQPHVPTLPNPSFAGKSGNGDWADVLAEMDHNVGQMVDAVEAMGIADNTIIIFASDNGAEYVRPWDGWAGPWRGQYFTAWEGGIRVPFIVRWPGRIPARVSNALYHGVDLFPTLARLTGASVPSDRPIDGIDQSAFWMDNKDVSGRESVLIFCAERLQAVKWRNYKIHFYLQETMLSPAQKLGIPLFFNLYTNPREEDDKITFDTWIIGPILKAVREFEASVKDFPLIPMGTPDPYRPKRARS